MKRKSFLTILGIIILIIAITLVSKITYAFFISQHGVTTTGDIDVTSKIVDKLTFTLGDAIAINATSTTLPENGSNIQDSTTATATLVAGNANDSATFSYDTNIIISNNTFTYTNVNTPEIILTVEDITDPLNITEVDSLGNLTYGTYNGVTGFDITEETGTFTITNSISALMNETVNKTLRVTVTYLNLTIDQSANFGHSLGINVQMEEHSN